MKLGSLFDGSGGFPLAATMCGIIPVWASEVEPYPIAVTRSRFPNMKHLGDVSKVNGAEIEPVDIITFGSPCQDLSVAGKRAGIKDGTRSGLFLEAIRIIKEMRESTGGLYPTFALWENVPGAFSSNNGEDFRTVLQEFVKIKEPSAVMPPVPAGGWPYADCYMGDGWSLAYRTLDAQYWGVPQRRRRIYLVADFRGQRAGEILFKRQGLRGYFTESGTPWEGAAADAENSVETDDREAGCLNPWDNQSRRIFPPDAQYQTLYAAEKGGGQRHGVCIPINTILIAMNDNKVQRYIVRRLTPTECARLQGFPDKWGHPDHKDDFTDDEYQFWVGVRNTHAAINGKAERQYTKEQMLTWYNKLHTDSAEYRMWGNGIALPTALYVMQGIAEELEEETE